MFPLVPLRKSPDGIWQLVEITEQLIVPVDPPYSLKLTEMPDNGELKVSPVIIGLSQTTSYPPQSGSFFINYKNADIFFNESESGNTYSITYWGKGSPLTPDKLNTLNTNIVTHTSDQEKHLQRADLFPFYPSSCFTYITQDTLFADTSSTTLTYNANGFVDTITFSTGRLIKYLYNSHGFVSKETFYDFNGTTIIHSYTYNYDSNYRLTSKIYTAGN
jgi:hypothetical protein